MARQGSRVNAFVKKAERYFKVKNYAGAESVLRKGLVEIPGNSKLLHLAGRAAYHLGNYQEVLGLEIIGRPGPVFLRAGNPAVDVPQMVVLVPLPPDTIAPA